ncbi:MAG: thioredoxin [Tannerellaceae bacterium]|jgi:thioredoxin|nr:thioredoxin [Tannerellaceae bacterium]
MKKLIYILLLALAAGMTGKAQTAAPPAEGKTVSLDKAAFLSKVADYVTTREWKYLGDKPALIDFYADWCGPCKVIAPSLEELAETFKEQIYVYKIDIEAERELAALFNVRSIPFLLFIPMGENPQYVSGAVPKHYLDEIIHKVLLKQ